jgi:O-antigen ligase
MRSSFLLLQFISFFVAVAFAAGGGNYPGLIASSFIYMKGLLLTYPVIVLAVQIILYPQMRRNLIEILIQNKLICLYLLIALFSVSLGVNWIFSLNRVLYTLLGTAALFSLVTQYWLYMRRVKEIDILYTSINVLTCLAIIYTGIIIALHDFSLSNFRSDFQENWLIHPNLFSSFCAHLLIWHIAVLWLGKRSTNIKVIGVISIVILTGIIALLFSRTAILSMVLTLILGPLLYGILYRRLKPLLFSGMAFTGALFVILLAITGVIPLDNILQTITRNGDTESLFSLTNRVYLWRDILSAVDMKIVLIGNGYAVMTQDFGMDFGTGILYGAHNAYLSVFLGCGIFALVVLLAYLLSNIIKLIRLRFSAPSFMIWAGLCSYMVFLINCLAAEEIGINTSVTFAYVIFLTNMIFGMRHENPSDRI